MRDLSPFESAIVMMHPSIFMGFRIGDFIRFLRGHRIDPVYWPKVAVASLCGVATSAISVVESRFAARLSVDEEVWRRPVFILGLPRSGTTHLFELLAASSMFAYPARIDCFNPHTFLSLRRLGLARALGRRRLRTRVIDNVKVGWMTPEEDEVAILALTGMRGCVWRVFPRELSAEPAGEFFADPDGPEAQRWKWALRTFTRKLSALFRKPLLLKSPSHTMKVAEILSVFPDARFITIFREPFAHFRSYRAMFGSNATGWDDLQRRPRWTDRDFCEVIGRQLRRYFATRGLIPEGQLVEIRHEDVIASPRETLGAVFGSWGQEVPGELLARLAAPDAAPYRKNVYPRCEAGTFETVRATYAPLYERAYYEPGAPSSMDA